MQHSGKRRAKAPGHRRECLLFLIASAIGVYSLGQGLQGVFFPGQAVSLVWLAVAGLAMWILFAQMARVKDTWLSRTKEAKVDHPGTQRSE